MCLLQQSVVLSILLSEELSGTGLESMTPQLGIETTQMFGATPEGPPGFPSCSLPAVLLEMFHSSAVSLPGKAHPSKNF